MTEAKRDQNFVTTILGVSSTDGVTTIPAEIDPITGRLLVDVPAGIGTVTSVSVVTANGFAGSVATATTTPAITLSTTVTGILKGNGTAISAAVANTDYQSPITLTTTGTSGASTFDGTTLNIPQYQAAGTYVTSVSGTTNRITSTGGTTPVIDISASYVGQASITTLGTIATGVWQGTSISTTYTDAKIKTVTGTTNRITIGGTATDPTFDISTSYVGQATITTLGTITTGVWNGTTIAVANGGTGKTSWTQYLIPYADTTTSFSQIAIGTAGQVLTSNGAGVAPTFQNAAGGIPTQITVANEATDTSCFVAFFTAATGDLGPKTNANLTFNSNTGVLTLVAPILGTPTSVTLTNATGLPLTTGVTGTLGAASGGTGVANNAASTITISGNFATTFTVTNTTSVTLPLTGTLSTLAGTETLSNKTLTAPKFADLGFIADANGNELIIFDTVTSAVNEITFANAATGANPTFTASGGDSNIGFDFLMKGTGTFNLKGNSTQAAELRLYEDTDAGTNYSAFKVGTQAGNLTYTLPTALGSAGAVLTDAAGDGILSWAAGGGSANPGWDFVSYTTASASTDITVSSLDLVTDICYKIILEMVESGTNQAATPFVRINGITTSTYDYMVSYTILSGGGIGTAWTTVGYTAQARAFLLSTGNPHSWSSELIFNMLGVSGGTKRVVGRHQSTGTSNTNDEMQTAIGSFKETSQTNMTSITFGDLSTTKDWKVWVFKSAQS